MTMLYATRPVKISQKMGCDIHGTVNNTKRNNILFICVCSKYIHVYFLLCRICVILMKNTCVCAVFYLSEKSAVVY